MAAPPCFGDWIWAAFPRMTCKPRPGVFIALAPGRWGRAALAVPATAQDGAAPGTLRIPEAPMPGLRPCRLLAPHLSCLRADRIAPLRKLSGSASAPLVLDPSRGDTIRARLSPEAAERLRALLEAWYGPDLFARLQRRAPPYRLTPRSAAARRRGARSAVAG